MKASDRVQLQTGTKQTLRGVRRTYVTLANVSGVLTRAGTHYYNRMGQEPPQNLGFDAQQRPETRGNSEYIATRRGVKRKVRSWDPASGEFKYTSLGKRFYQGQPSQ